MTTQLLTFQGCFCVLDRELTVKDVSWNREMEEILPCLPLALAGPGVVEGSRGKALPPLLVLRLMGS